MKKITTIPPTSDLKLIQPKLRVAAYCRVSTDIDDQLVSLEAQKSHYESYIKANPQWEFAGVYYDEGISGTKKEKRAALLKLIKDCECKKVDFIVTKSISRFARNTTDCLEIVRKLVDIGVFIYFEKENINTKSMESELMLTILSSLAESESVSISQNAKWSIKKRFQNGTYKISYPPFGYIKVDGKLTVDVVQANIVKQIFELALSGNGSYRIADLLNAANAPTKKGGKWSASSVAAILRNDTYTGGVRLQKTFTDSNFNRHVNRGKKDQYIVKNHHKAIISHEDFEAVSKTMRLRGREKGIEKGASKYLARYPFSGKIKCSECGSNFKRRVHTNGESKYIAFQYVSLSQLYQNNI